MPRPQNNFIYQSPLARRYAGKEMLYNFSEEYKFRTWRTIWIALAEAERESGLSISKQQIAELKKFRDKINYAVAERYEKILQHDVMAHIRAYADQCPRARAIIHLGATSALVVDNADLIIMRNGLRLIRNELINLISALARFANKYKNLPTLGFTHFQPALVTTVGKRATLWLQDLVSDLGQLEFAESRIKCLGAKGAIGTQDSFLKLLNNNPGGVEKLDRRFAQRLGFKEIYPVTGQTYSRKLDYLILSALSSLAQSAHKFANDLRLLQGLGEMEEPFTTTQVGSSAMAYKRNPMKAERLTALARFVIINTQNTALTSAQQWLERTLDDSANKRLVIPEVFLATDAIISIYTNIIKGTKIYPAIIQKHLDENLPFLITEQLLMEGAKKGGDRQDIHERLRQLSMSAAERLKKGEPNDLMERLYADKLLKKVMPKSLKAMDYIGLADRQTEQFLNKYIKPILNKYH